ncbi:hypothetical protein F66182_5102 [Fusarium sp. NRRL 66182]|nr:hypothetical protein F66182_5102 [Fusarium sp. NRRL 66182]
MLPVSPEASSSTPVDAVSPPSYTPNADVPASDEKIAIPRQRIDDENLPEVVSEPTFASPPPQMSPPPASEHAPMSTVSPAPTSIMNYHDGTQSPPILQHPALAGTGQVQQGYTGHESMAIPPAQAPAQYPPGQTVTPLNLLAEQPDTVDCPFCQRRAETKVKKTSSQMTHIYATGLFFTTLFGVIFPYACHCASNISHHCKNCGRKVAFKQHGGQMEALGTPDHLREVSRFPAAEPIKKK